ncbi:MAG: hypothetical protein PHY15_07795 [Eubacteriales bacterium]|nr:hypothetical protein [Eubacteriales bacterium]MDD4476074.1 hypothetical protein [Eubacteriales bacterium]
MPKDSPRNRIAPSSPPPNTIPFYCCSYPLLDKEGMNQYADKYIYLWLDSNEASWYYLNEIERNNFVGYIWDKKQWSHRIIPISSVIGYY